MKKYSKLLVLFFTLVSFNGFAQCIASFNSTQPNCPDVQFLDGSFADFPASITSRAWDFGDGSPVDSTTNPTHTYAANGAYDVMLIIETSSGCRDTAINTVNVNCIPECNAGFSYNDTTNCPDVSFTDTSSASGTIISREWDFGDGNTSTATNPTHTYGANGTYTVQLIINTLDNCADTVSQDVTIACIVPATCTADFTFDDTNCPTVDFTDASSSNGTVNSWSWDFGDGNTANTQNPSHTYTANGSFDVQLIINTDNNCADTIVKTVNIACVTPPCDADFAFDTTACPTVQFSDSSTSNSTILTYAWDFADGNTSNLQNPSHTYSANGVYNVKLTITDLAGCSSTDSALVTISCVVPPTCNAGFSIDSSACPEVSFTDTSSSTDGPITSWSWDFGDGTTSNLQNPSNTYSAKGTYTVQLIINTLNGCADTTSTDITVSCIVPPTCNAGFAIDSSACPEVSFTDTSSSSDGPITGWSWDFGDGNTSNLQNPSNTYAANGTYTVQLIINTLNGCADTTSTDITVSCIVPPTCEAAFSIDSSACPEVSFTDTSSSTDGPITSWAWDFGDGNTSNLQNPSNTYAANGTYTVQLIINTLNGCADTTSTDITVSCIVPPTCEAGFSIDSSACPEVSFTDTSSSTDGAIVSWAWDFGDGNTSNLQNPSNTYGANGTYTVELIISTLNGCADTTSTDITVSCLPPPTCDAAFSFDTTNCPDVSFTDLSTASGNLVAWSWNFGDSDTSDVQNPTHTYVANGDYYVTLTITTDDNCTSTITDTVTISCYPPPTCNAKFAFADNCPKYGFVNQSTASDSIETYLWYFGDGDSSMAKNPIHTYAANGTYIVTLSITTVTNCKSTITDTITVGCYPPPTCEADFNTLVNNCNEYSFFNTSTSQTAVIAYQWAFGDGTTSNQMNPQHVYTENGIYEACLTMLTADTCISQKCVEIIIGCIPEPDCKAGFIANTAGCPDVAFLDTSTSVEPIVAWFWDFGDGSYSSQQDPFHSYEQPGNYDVCLRVITSDTCIAETCVPLEITCLDIEEESLDATQLYPNPAQNFLNVRLNKFEDNFEIKILSLNGQTVLAQQFFNTELIQVDLANIAPGMYLVELSNDKARATKKIVITE